MKILVTTYYLLLSTLIFGSEINSSIIEFKDLKQLKNSLKIESVNVEKSSYERVIPFEINVRAFCQSYSKNEFFVQNKDDEFSFYQISSVDKTLLPGDVLSVGGYPCEKIIKFQYSSDDMDLEVNQSRDAKIVFYSVNDEAYEVSFKITRLSPREVQQDETTTYYFYYFSYSDIKVTRKEVL